MMNSKCRTPSIKDSRTNRMAVKQRGSYRMVPCLRIASTLLFAGRKFCQPWSISTEQVPGRPTIRNESPSPSHLMIKVCWLLCALLKYFFRLEQSQHSFMFHVVITWQFRIVSRTRAVALAAIQQWWLSVQVECEKHKRILRRGNINCGILFSISEHTDRPIFIR